MIDAPLVTQSIYSRTLLSGTLSWLDVVPNINQELKMKLLRNHR